jgi:hypothetical protein
MTDSAWAESQDSRWSGGWNQVATLVVLVAAADALLLRQPAGLGWVVLLALLAMMIALPHRSRAPEALMMQAGMAMLAILPLAENVSLLSFAVAMTGVAAYALAVNERLASGGAAIVRQLGGFFLLVPFRLISDAMRARLHQRDSGLNIAGGLVWVVPVLFGLVFLALFGVANPVIEDWINRIDLTLLLRQLDADRILFWGVMACGLWAYLQPRSLKRRVGHTVERPKVAVVAEDCICAALFGRAALLRALLVFNALFLVQNGLDIAYLWGGVSLPAGMSHAAYAHRGAYALIATALLAAGFVLTAMRPGSETSSDRLVRKLVYAWTTQNIWLVASSILRLDLYVDTYALTYWRVAAFLWMLLVAAGLALIVARIALEKSNQWLVSANLMTLSAMLYACCFINFAGLIANYNVDHSLEMRGSGLPADIWYLSELGPEAIPALDRLAAVGVTVRRCHDSQNCVPDIRSSLASSVWADADNWRNWTYRNLRLMRYLIANPPVLQAGDDERGNP